MVCKQSLPLATLEGLILFTATELDNNACPGQVDSLKGHVKENFICPTGQLTEILVRMFLNLLHLV